MVRHTSLLKRIDVVSHPPSQCNRATAQAATPSFPGGLPIIYKHNTDLKLPQKILIRICENTINQHRNQVLFPVASRVRGNFQLATEILHRGKQLSLDNQNVEQEKIRVQWIILALIKLYASNILCALRNVKTLGLPMAIFAIPCQAAAPPPLSRNFYQLSLRLRGFRAQLYMQ